MNEGINELGVSGMKEESNQSLNGALTTNK